MIRHLLINCWFILLNTLLIGQTRDLVLLSNRIQGQHFSWLIDNSFNIIHEWSHPAAVHSIVYLQNDSTLIVPLRIFDPYIEYSNPIGGHFQKVGWNGDLIWDFTYYGPTYNPHHDIEPLPNGNILVICWEVKTLEEAVAVGRQNINGEIWPLKIVELEPPDGTVVWEWHLWDHLIQDVNPALDNFGDISQHPGRMDINCGGPVNSNNGDWIHTNAIDYREDLDQIIFSSRHMNEIYIIDHSTTTEEATSSNGGNYGKGGDFLFRWGNPQNYGQGTDENRILSAPHASNWIKKGMPGEKNILIFNNQPYGNQEGNSEVFEIHPPILEDGSYFILDDSTWGSTEIIWHYGGDSTFYSGSQSGAYRTPLGNTIITVSQEARVFEVDSLGSTVWDCYIHEDLNFQGWTSRAQRIHPGFFQLPRGDFDADYSLNILDIFIFDNYLNGNSEINTHSGDLNEDGVFNMQDLEILICLLTGSEC